MKEVMFCMKLCVLVECDFIPCFGLCVLSLIGDCQA